jgi:hypothetical protein
MGFYSLRDANQQDNQVDHHLLETTQSVNTARQINSGHVSDRARFSEYQSNCWQNPFWQQHTQRVLTLR